MMNNMLMINQYKIIDVGQEFALDPVRETRSEPDMRSSVRLGGLFKLNESVGNSHCSSDGSTWINSSDLSQDSAADLRSTRRRLQRLEGYIKRVRKERSETRNMMIEDNSVFEVDFAKAIAARKV